MSKMAIVLALAALQGTGASQPAGTVPQTMQGRMILFNQPNYNGEDMEIDGVRRVLRWDYHPRSIAIHPGDRWEICALPRFQECITLGRSVPDAELIGIPAGRDIGSIRPAQAPAPGAAPAN